MRYIFAGDRQISVNILQWLMAKGYKPEALLVSLGKGASHTDELIELSGVPEDKIFYGKDFRKKEVVLLIAAMDVDYIFGIHFPYIIPAEVLSVPKIGFLNLHPAYLPYNKGWHTPSWAIMDGTPYGATLHFMSEELDQGDIIYQKEIEVRPEDTANSLYSRVLELEEEVFYEAFDDILSLSPKRISQTKEGTAHVKKDLFEVQEVSLDSPISPRELIKKLRALTTNKISEAAYFEEGGNKYHVRVEIIPEVQIKSDV